LKNNIIAACDIGSSKVCCGIARIDENSDFSLIGFGEVPSKGIRKGVVSNIETVTTNITDAVTAAEIMSGENVSSLTLNISGDHISSTNSIGVVAVSGKNKEINYEDVRRVIEAARTVVIPKGRELIHVLEQHYCVDDQSDIKYPIGMTGVRLETSVHLVSGSMMLLRNLKNAVIRAGYNFQDIIISSLASAEACISQDEKELGVLVIDIGSDMTDIICYHNDAVAYSACIPLGGSYITKDISIILKIPIKEAENIKKNSGNAYPSLVDEDEKVEIPAIGANPSRLESKKLISQIIEARVKEILSLVEDNMEKADLRRKISSGIVVTGGTAKLTGIENLIFDVLKVPVRIGYPYGFNSVNTNIFSPEYSTLIGLLLLSVEDSKTNMKPKEKKGFFDQFKNFFSK
jgi:cell division protein FtsA